MAEGGHNRALSPRSPTTGPGAGVPRARSRGFRPWGLHAASAAQGDYRSSFLRRCPVEPHKVFRISSGARSPALTCRMASSGIGFSPPSPCDGEDNRMMLGHRPCPDRSARPHMVSPAPNGALCPHLRGRARACFLPHSAVSVRAERSEQTAASGALSRKWPKVVPGRRLPAE
mgnify:CR=1 FL=1